MKISVGCFLSGWIKGGLLIFIIHPCNLLARNILNQSGWIRWIKIGDSSYIKGQFPCLHARATSQGWHGYTPILRPDRWTLSHGLTASDTATRDKRGIWESVQFSDACPLTHSQGYTHKRARGGVWNQLQREKG